MVQEIQFTGYTTSPSDYEAPDGQLAAAINVIPEDGHLTAIPQPTTIAQLPSSQKILFVHKVSIEQRFYIVAQEGQLLYSSDLVEFETIDNACISDVDTIQLSAIGNIITVVEPKQSLFYLRYDTNANKLYTYIDGCLPSLDIAFALAGEFQVKSYNERTVDVTKYNGTVTSYDTLLVTAQIYGTGTAVSDWINCNLPVGKYKLTWTNNPWFDRIWIFTNHNEPDNDPGLYVGNSTEFKFTVTSDISSIKFKIQGIKSSNTISADLSLYGSSTVSEGWMVTNTTEAYNNVLGAANEFIAVQHEQRKFLYPFYVRYAYRMYDGSYTGHSAPILMIPGMDDNPRVFWHQYNGTHAKLAVCAAVCKLMYRINDNAVEVMHKLQQQYRDIVTSVDIFISAPIYTYNMGREFDSKTENISVVYTVSEGTDNNYSIFMPNGSDEVSLFKNWTMLADYGIDTNSINPIKIPTFDYDELVSKFESTSTFYRAASINIQDLQESENFNDVVFEPGFSIKSIVTRPTLPDDTLKSHNPVVPSLQFAYNGRLNISKYGERLFKGFNPIFCNTASDTGSCVLFAKIHIKTTQGTFYVSTPAYGSMDYLFYFFYPDTRACKAEIYIFSDFIKGIPQYKSWTKLDIDLKQHPFLNGAYWLGDLRMPTKTYLLASIYNSDSPIYPTDENTPLLIDEYSQIYTSEINNPFVFTQASSLGTGEILGISSAAKALSQGQFGQFPLYAFTTEGVWALEVSTTGTYTARQPITRDVCINQKSITQLDSAVLFATDRGIMLLIGSQAECITENIDAQLPFDITSLPHIQELHKLIGHDIEAEGGYGCLPTVPFLTILQDCSMIYDYVHQHIIVYNHLYTYAYVFSLRSKQWGMTYSNIATRINSYPDALAITKPEYNEDSEQQKHRLITFSEANNTSPVSALYVTRPLKLATPNILKTIHTVIQRGLFQRGDVKTVLYASNDLYNWTVIKSSSDHELRTFGGTPYKYFRIAAVATLTPDKSIFGASIDFQTRMTNRLR